MVSIHYDNNQDIAQNLDVLSIRALFTTLGIFLYLPYNRPYNLFILMINIKEKPEDMSDKSSYVQQKKLNPADELRALLTSLESQGPQLKSLDATAALSLLNDLDQTDDLFAQLASLDLDLSAEQGRFTAIEATLRKNVAKVLKTLGGPTVLERHRPQPVPSQERWWWYMPKIVAANQRHTIKRLITAGVVVLAVLGIIVLVFNTILAPSPEAIARVEAERDAFSAIETDNYDEALIAVDQGLTVIPNDAGLLMLKGVLLELINDINGATAGFDQAKANLDGLYPFHFGRGQLYFRTKQLDKAEIEAKTAIELDEKQATGWLLLGQVFEAQDRKGDAIAAYQQASGLALENEESEVVVLSRMALGRLGLTP